MEIKSAANGKQVRRSEIADSVENNKKRVQNSEKLYKRRQAIVEHPFGTIKRSRSFGRDLITSSQKSTSNVPKPTLDL